MRGGDREGCHSREEGTGRGATHERRGQGGVPLVKGGDREGCHS